MPATRITQSWHLADLLQRLRQVDVQKGGLAFRLQANLGQAVGREKRTFARRETAIAGVSRDPQRTLDDHDEMKTIIRTRFE